MGVPSSQSVHTYTSSFSSLAPDSSGYHYEFERLQIEYRRSQEALRLERESAMAQRELFERDRAAREAQHEQELETLRREMAADKAKRRR